ncbi:MAG: potassium transporter TrkG [Planctomycetota bacterium]
MRSADFVTRVRYRTLGTELARVLRLCGLLQLPPLVVAALAGEGRQALVFAGLAAGTYLPGRLGARRGGGDLHRGEALVVSALAYLVFACAGALALLPVASFGSGLFETMSGYTTTGLSVLDPQALPASLLWFRAYTQWVGGAGIVVLSLVVLSWPARTMFPTYAAELADKSLAGSVVATARLVLKVYAALSATCVIAYVLVGMPWFDAVVHAMTTVSTGGFASHGDSIRAFPGAAVPVVVCVFMVLGATAFPLLARVRRDGPRALAADPQLRALLGLAAIALALPYLLGDAARADGAAGLRDRAFLALSAITTTGFETAPVRDLGGTTLLLTTALMCIGGAAGSTAGGIKLVRCLIALSFLRDLVLRPLLPDEAKVPVRLGGAAVDDAVVRQVLGLVLLYGALLFTSTVVLTASGIAGMDALFESASALGTVGLSCGVTSASLGTVAKGVLAFDMWAGRLEILAVLVLLYPSTWRRATIAA